MIGKHRAYALLTMLILFNFAIPVAGAMGFNPTVTSETVSVGSKTVTDLYVNGIGDWSFWLSVAGITSLLIIASKAGIRVTFSTIIFTGVFLGTSTPIHGLLNNMESTGYMPSGLVSLIVGIYALAFIIGVVEVSR